MNFLDVVLIYLRPAKIKEVAKKHNSEDRRKRKLPLMLYVLFTIFSSEIKENRSYLPQVVTEIKRIFGIDITKQAISKQMVKKRSWKVFRDLFRDLSRRTYRCHPKMDKEKLGILHKYSDILISDSSSFKVFKTLIKKYQSTHEHIAGCKLHTLFSFSDFHAVKVKVTEQKLHDNNFNFVTLKKAYYIYLISDIGHLKQFGKFIVENLILFPD